MPASFAWIRALTSFWKAAVLAVVLSSLGGAPAPAQKEAGASETRALPQVDLTGLEPSVAAQLGDLEELAESVLAGEATPAEKAEAVGELGRHYHAYELLEPAEACYRHAALLAPRDFRWRYHLGYLLQNAGRLEEAAAEYERALGIHAKVPPALVRLAQVYLALDQTEAAEEVLVRALTLDETSSAALAVIGEVYLARERYREAVAALERALDYTPEANRLFYPLALAYRGLGDEDRARALIAQRGPVGVRPADPLIDGLAELTTGERVHLLRGRSAFAAGRYVEAVEEFEQAVAANSESVSALVNLGSALAYAQRGEEALGVYRRAIELAPGNATARLNLGILLSRAGRLDQAATALRGAIQYAPRDAMAHLELAGVLRRSDRSEEALTHYALAIDLEPANEVARVGRAGALVALGRYAEALDVLEQAHAALPASGRIAASLAKLLAACPDPALRDGARALVLAKAVYEGLPQAEHAELVAEALAELGRCDEAAEVQEALIEKLGDQSSPADAARWRAAVARYRAGESCRPAVGPDPQAGQG